MVKIHVIYWNKVIRRLLLPAVPSKGDEIRINETTCYQVRKVIWIADEPECIYSRANVAVRKLKP